MLHAATLIIWCVPLRERVYSEGDWRGQDEGEHHQEEEGGVCRQRGQPV